MISFLSEVLRFVCNEYLIYAWQLFNLQLSNSFHSIVILRSDAKGFYQEEIRRYELVVLENSPASGPLVVCIWVTAVSITVWHLIGQISL